MTDDRIDDEALEFAIRWQGTFVAVVLGLIFAGGVLLTVILSEVWP